jgi:hypothetical protein
MALWPILVSSANSLPKPDILSATSFIKIRKSNGSKTDPWGTPAFNSPVLDIASLITTRCFRLVLFNRSIQEMVFPDQWKIAHVIALLKKGDKSLPSNYRPVSLLSCVSKILEKHVQFSTDLEKPFLVSTY